MAGLPRVGLALLVIGLVQTTTTTTIENAGVHDGIKEHKSSRSGGGVERESSVDTGLLEQALFAIDVQRTECLYGSCLYGSCLNS